MGRRKVTIFRVGIFGDATVTVKEFVAYQAREWFTLKLPDGMQEPVARGRDGEPDYPLMGTTRAKALARAKTWALGRQRRLLQQAAMYEQVVANLEEKEQKCQ